MSIWKAISDFFKKKKKETPQPQKPTLPKPEVPVHPEPTPVVVVPPTLPSNKTTEKDFVYNALNVSQTFEGEIPWANPTGNFDGMGLTMGALGWTIYYGQQRDMVKLFVSRHGLEKLKQLMPQGHSTYWSVCNMSNAQQAVKYISAWSNGSKVKEPYRSELIKLWTTKEMQDIQVEETENTIAKFAFKTGREFATKLNVPFSFDMFLFFFDWAVLNGASFKGVSFDSVHASIGSNPKLALKYLIRDADAGSSIQYNNTSAVLCARLWSKLEASTVPTYRLYLVEYGRQRALASKYKFQLTTLCRRGTLALGEGYVNDTKRDFKKLYEEVKFLG